ncbi:hypothetical protein NPX13_g1990 [Xylaria arbuscula]|uniref:Uncharacterized protein n=1 Tax=Xylaria arbuscula TaxID=114810 RepID=A0A9W8NKM9_9PEZI|nr:hypothetical protein NPX13_g1990 [Xylaria arbuscula]
MLKVFKFYDPSATKWSWGRRLDEDYPIEKAIYYTDPFYAECRAYGRIKEAAGKGEIRGKIAAKCHGYLFLNTDAQRWLRTNGYDLGAGYFSDDLLAMQGGFGRPRAIVKDLEIEGPGVADQTPQQIRKSFWAVRQLNLLGIYNRDVRAENFRNGWLVDFDMSCTIPHDIYDSLPSFEAHTMKGRDLVSFEDMLEEAGVKMRFLRTKYYNFRPRRK